MEKVRKQAKISSFKSKLEKNIILFNRKGETRLFLFLSFLIPFLTVWFFFAQNEVHPFGSKQILVTDLWHQYYPFFRVEHEKLHGLSSLLYSWRAGIGTNFLSLMSYYAASPLNFLAVFFPIEYSRDALTLFLTVKIGCAGLFFAVFVKHVFGRNDFSITAFGVCYALCDYIMGYYWNIIWIDTVALLPLVVLGTIKLYKEGRYKLYIIALALSLMTSFYIGLFTCIFTVMVFAAMVIIEWDGFKNAFKKLGQISGATVIGIGIGAVLLLPAYLGLMLTNSANNEFPKDITYYEEWLKMISSVIGFHEPTAKEGLPNYYCGMFAVVLLGAFISSAKIKLREKFVTAAYLIFIVVSCNMNVLNYMWHGFHFTNMLPYRFSFLLSFILLAAGYRAFDAVREEAKFIDIAAMAVMGASIALISYSFQPKKALIYSAAASALFVLVTLMYRFRILNKSWLNFIICLMCAAEMGMNAKIGVETVSVTDYLNYPRKEAAITEIIDELESNDDFFRMETTTNYSINDPALYGYRGISQFSSTANVNVTTFMHEMGIDASEAGNRYYYNQNTAVFNTFMNLKYILSTENFSGDLTCLEPTAENDTVNVFTNKYYLPIGFAVSNSLLNYSGGFFNQFDNQNELFSRATGITDDVLRRVEIKDVGHKNLNVSKTGYGTYNFQYSAPVDDEDSECYLKYNYEIKNEGPVYAVFKFSDIESVKIKNGSSIVHTQHGVDKYIKIFAAGEFKPGDIMTLQADIEEEKGGSGSIYVYQLDKEVFEKGYDKLAKGSLNVTDYGDTHIKGTINAEGDCLMYTSIPYDGGWKAYIDGKRSETKSLKNALTCVPLTAGEHEIELRYSPPGFAAGLCITIVSLALFILLWIFEPKLAAVFAARSEKNAADSENAGDKPEEEKQSEEKADDAPEKAAGTDEKS